MKTALATVAVEHSKQYSVRGTITYQHYNLIACVGIAVLQIEAKMDDGTVINWNLTHTPEKGREGPFNWDVDNTGRRFVFVFDCEKNKVKIFCPKLVSIKRIRKSALIR